MLILPIFVSWLLLNALMAGDLVDKQHVIDLLDAARPYWERLDTGMRQRQDTFSGVILWGDGIKGSRSRKANSPVARPSVENHLMLGRISIGVVIVVLLIALAHLLRACRPHLRRDTPTVPAQVHPTPSSQSQATSSTAVSHSKSASPGSSYSRVSQSLSLSAPNNLFASSSTSSIHGQLFPSASSSPAADGPSPDLIQSSDTGPAGPPRVPRRKVSSWGTVRLQDGAWLPTVRSPIELPSVMTPTGETPRRRIVVRERVKTQERGLKRTIDEIDS
ncbi:hypothetical protein H2248_012205 [Termitomyces sp. 'cryptogamus']|nr:hypothetical protein H2248_012205 [Termitomyces sp. 'cryptogamus']